MRVGPCEHGVGSVRVRPQSQHVKCLCSCMRARYGTCAHAHVCASERAPPRTAGLSWVLPPPSRVNDCCMLGGPAIRVLPVGAAGCSAAVLQCCSAAGCSAAVLQCCSAAGCSAGEKPAASSGAEHLPGNHHQPCLPPSWPLPRRHPATCRLPRLQLCRFHAPLRVPLPSAVLYCAAVWCGAQHCGVNGSQATSSLSPQTQHRQHHCHHQQQHHHPQLQQQ